MILIDTDVLVDFTRGDRATIDTVRSIKDGEAFISVVTEMELLCGARDKREAAAIRRAIEPVEILHISEDISMAALNLIARYSLGHGLRIADSLIAATAISHSLSLFTNNKKHFRSIAGLELYKP